MQTLMEEIVRAVIRGDNVEALRRVFIRAHPEFEPAILPHKEFMITGWVEGDTYENAVLELGFASTMLRRKEVTSVINGSGILNVIHDPTMSPVRFLAEINAYLAIRSKRGN